LEYLVLVLTNCFEDITFLAPNIAALPDAFVTPIFAKTPSAPRKK
jgi:hypothetical protein